MKRQKISLEYPINCTVQSLYRAISTAVGLRQWFADDVSLDGNEFTFVWSKSSQTASIIHHKENVYIRMSWTNDPADYFELRIESLELSGAIALVVTDFTDEADYDDTVSLWNNQVSKLKRVIGCAKK